MRGAPFFALLFLAFPAALTLAQSTIEVPRDQPTIQAGINAARSGDTVLVAPGTYDESIDFSGKAISVKSSGGAAVTILDGGMAAYTVLFKSGELRDSVVQGFTIQNGGRVANSSLAYGAGGPYGGVGIVNAAPAIVNNIITRNFCHGISVSGGSPLIQDNEISATLNPGGVCSAAGGAGIWIESGYQNSGLFGAPGPPVVVGNTIEDNIGSGGEDAAGEGGGGIVSWGGSPIIENNTIRRNMINAGSGGGINILSSGSIVAQNLIYGNTAACGGGGLAFGWGEAPKPGPVTSLVVNNLIAGNSTNHACGVSGQQDGSEVYLRTPDSRTEFANNLIVGSTSDAAIFCDPAGSLGSPHEVPLFDHNDIDNSHSKASLFGGSCPEQAGSYGNISADPLFVDAAHHDYRLQAGSPGIDSGNNSALQQLKSEGAALGYGFASNSQGRQQDATGQGFPIVDIGPYEYAGAQPAGATAMVLTPSAYQVGGSRLALTAQLVSPDGAPTGTVRFFQGQKQIGAAPVLSISGTSTATITAPLLPPGTYDFVATYAGAPGFSPGLSVKAIVFVTATTASGDATSISLASSNHSANLGQPVTLSATVSSPTGTPTGSIVFTNGGTTLATQSLINGVATYTTTSLPVGSRTITATYQPGSSGFAAGSASLTQVVNGLPTATATALTPSPLYALEPATLTAQVTGQGGIPPGTVAFAANGAALGSAMLNSAGVATLSSSFPAPGAESLVATYGGGGSYGPSSSPPDPVTVLINPTTTAVSATPNPASAFQSTMLVARVGSSTAASFGAIATGTVTFYDGATVIGSAGLNGNATAAISIVTFSTGTHAITAVYAGATAFAPSTSAAYSLTVTPDPTVTQLSAAPNPAELGASVLFNASIAAIAVPSGPMSFYDGATLLGTAPLDANGNAAFTTSSLAIGLHAITAVYGGGPNFTPSTSGVVEEQIVAYTGSFSITVTPGTASLYTGESAKFTVTLAPGSGWDHDVGLTCPALPANTSCAFTPATIPGANGVAQLVIQTSAPQHISANRANRFPGRRNTGAALASLAVLLLPFRRRGQRSGRFPGSIWPLALLAIVLSAGLSGCGAGPVTQGTPSGVYTVPVAATFSIPGATLTHTAPIVLTVKSLF